MAHTTSDWPRRMSPAAKTPGHVGHAGGRIGGHVAARVERDAELIEHPAALGAQEAHGQQHERARARSSREPGISFIAKRPFSRTHSMRTVSMAFDAAVRVADERLVVTQ